MVWVDSDEWDHYRAIGDTVLHVNLAKRNSLLLIAPASGNTLASLALGFSGNLLTSVVRAWYYDLNAAFERPISAKFGVQALNRPVVVAPSLNTYMLEQNVSVPSAVRPSKLT